MKPIKPIPEWQDAWKFASMWVATAAGIFGSLPPDQQAAMLEFLHVPPERLPLVLAVAFMLARVFKKAD